MLIPFIVIIPGMISAVLVGEMTEFKQAEAAGDAATAAATGVTYNDALLLLMRDVLPNGLLGVAIAGLLAAFMAGMAANCQVPGFVEGVRVMVAQAAVAV